MFYLNFFAATTIYFPQIVSFQIQKCKNERKNLSGPKCKCTKTFQKKVNKCILGQKTLQKKGKQMYSWTKVQRSVSVLIPQNEMMIFKFKYFPQPGEFTANWSQVSKILSFIIFSSNGSRVQVMSCHHHPLLPDAYNYCVIHQKRVTWLMIGSWFFVLTRNCDLITAC